MAAISTVSLRTFMNNLGWTKSAAGPSPPRRPDPRWEGRPPRILPVLYIGAAHLFLSTAFLLVAVAPGEVVGFFLHPRMVAIVHLITLGWITVSILGALYVIGPMGLRTPMPARPLDYLAFSLVAIGIVGMVSHSWIDSYAGAGWSAVLLIPGVGQVGFRTLRGLRWAPIAPAVKGHFFLAFLNLMAAGSLGILLAFDKLHPFLSARGLSHLYAHAHLAAIGWAALIAVGSSYRMLPMVLPSAMPAGRGLWTSALLLEVGAVGLFFGFLAGSRLRSLFGLCAAGGFVAFLHQVGWMRRRPRPAPAGRPRPDYAVRHVAQSLGYLILSLILGVTLAFAPETETSLKAAGLYGLFGLVGFLAQLVVGVEMRILPMFTVYHANRNCGHTRPPILPDTMPWRSLQKASFSLWTVGVPLLAAGWWAESVPVVAAAGGLLLAGVLLGGVNTARVLAHAFLPAQWPN